MAPSYQASSKFTFRLYILFIISFFIHLPSRIPALGLIRFDLLLVLLIFAQIFTQRKHIGSQSASEEVDMSKEPSKYIFILFALAVFTLPFVQWPGSVLGHGLPLLIKATVFLFFTIALVKTEKQLKIFISVYILCNLFRVLEPLFLHITTGYWGAKTWMGGEFEQRLAGAPSDVVNANGLAFVIASILPFLHYFLLSGGKLKKILYFLILPLLLWTMALTLSRTGILAILIIYFAVFIKSKNKMLFVALGMVGAIIFFSSLDDNEKDRYMSLTGAENRSSATAGGRMSGAMHGFEVGLNKPIFGHGLGTSKEANYHYTGNAQPAHILYAEILQEMGFVGLIVFLLFIKSLIKNLLKTMEFIKKSKNRSLFLYNLGNGLQTWMVMNLLFSLASYGLTSYEWYLFGGLSVVVLRIAKDQAQLQP